MARRINLILSHKYPEHPSWKETLILIGKKYGIDISKDINEPLQFPDQSQSTNDNFIFASTPDYKRLLGDSSSESFSKRIRLDLNPEDISSPVIDRPTDEIDKLPDLNSDNEEAHKTGVFKRCYSTHSIVFKAIEVFLILHNIFVK